jgi:hypothetical protein
MAGDGFINDVVFHEAIGNTTESAGYGGMRLDDLWDRDWSSPGDRSEHHCGICCTLFVVAAS